MKLSSNFMVTMVDGNLDFKKPWLPWFFFYKGKLREGTRAPHTRSFFFFGGGVSFGASSCACHEKKNCGGGCLKNLFRAGVPPTPSIFRSLFLLFCLIDTASDPHTETCKYELCNCDATVAHCFADNEPRYNSKHKGVSKSSCQHAGK